MKIHYLQHVSFEDAANINIWAKEKGYEITYSRLYTNESLPLNDHFDWLIIMGGPMNIYEDKKYPWLVREKKYIENAIKDKKIVLGICLGAQLIADIFGGTVYRNKYKEIGWFPVSLAEGVCQTEKAFSLSKEFMAFHWHGDTFNIPKGCTKLAESEACENQAFEYNDHVIGLQFHLESSFDSVTKLIKNYSDELIEGKYIQTADHIFSKGKQFKDLYESMNLLLNNLDKKYKKDKILPFIE